MMQVDRKNYTTSMEDAYYDRPLSIGGNQTISAPHMHATALELLKDNLFPGAKALDVGSGSGYLTCAMAKMVGNTGFVIGIERIPSLVETAKQNISRGNPEVLPNIQIKSFNAWDDHIEGGPFDAIHVGAAASSIPQSLLNQLANGGSMVIPLGTEEQNLYQFNKDSDGKITQRLIFSVRYVPLVNDTIL
eukprot:TRINITY_DN1677_c0_g1_i1.p1 TRINITY_DN1677_c0_g1~~TRINITY_DN1677_c0_g1_i1.p1  ORF type:complete len:190 (+),score=39.02 TRINITY_DN1677_c0_g1_i1:459-1028(+)